MAEFEDNHGCYFDRTPEKLVLEGYRRWIAGYDTGSVRPWELAWDLYAALLGPQAGRRAWGELGHFVRTLRQCANCPLRSFPFGAHHVCREECLALGLIAGLQHADRNAVHACLNAISCPLRAGEVSAAAGEYAETLASMRHYLLPIPEAAIADIVARAAPAQHETVH